jgi:RND family efflux transporter MFP subunit
MNILLLIGALLLNACGDKEATTLASGVVIKAPTVAVQTAPLRRGRIDRTLMVYGVVIPSPNKTKSFSVPFESVIEQEWVNVGEEVVKNDRLLTLKPSPETRLQLEQARIELQAARQQRGLIRERVRLKLATKQNLVAADSRFSQASEQLHSLTRRGIGKTYEIRATAQGIVYQMNVRQGQIVAAGVTLLQTVDHNQLLVRFGVEPEDISSIHEQQLVRMQSVHNHDDTAIEGRIHTLTHQIDPNTRLVTVLVQPVVSAGLLLNDYIEGQIVLQSKQTLLAPVAALLPTEKAFRLYTLKEGRAVAHEVCAGLRTSTEVEVISDQLKQGEAVVTSGNYQLESGSAVRMEATP